MPLHDNNATIVETIDEKLSGVTDGILDYCEEQYGPARDDLEERLEKKRNRKDLTNMLLQRLSWIAAITGGAAVIYNLFK